MTEYLHHPAATRKSFEFGFMKAKLCFKPELQPDRRRFGPLVTIDDAVLSPGARGFGFHPHHDLEVMTFLVEGAVTHFDQNESAHDGTIESKAAQIFTSGTGIVHNETNALADLPTRALQIWFLPRSTGLAPRYSRKELDPSEYEDTLCRVLSPEGQAGGLPLPKTWTCSTAPTPSRP